MIIFAFSTFDKETSGKKALLPKVLANFSIVFGKGFTSEAIIIGFPNFEICFIRSLFLASLLLVKSIILPFVSRIAMPTVVPGSIPTIIDFFS